MTTVNVYLAFDGNCLEAFTFYQSVFGGEIPFAGRFRDMPPQEGMPPIPEDQLDRVMHISLPISKETMLMGSDTAGGWGPPHQIGNNFSISVNTDDRAEAERIFTGLSEGGTVTMPMADTFWGDYFGMVTDAFGVNWMVSYRAGEE